jgi:hypothetical protein
VRNIVSALLTVAVLATVTTGCKEEGDSFSCTRRSGDWGLFKSRPDGPELIACFGGMSDSADDKRMCDAALKFAEMGAGEFFCSVFP